MLQRLKGGSRRWGRLIGGTRGLQHSFDRRAAEWFGGIVSQNTYLAKWEALVERAGRSGKQVDWVTGADATVGHLARIDGNLQQHRAHPTPVDADLDGAGQMISSGKLHAPFMELSFYMGLGDHRLDVSLLLLGELLTSAPRTRRRARSTV